MKILKRQNLAEDIAEYLAEKIISMELKPGEQIREAKTKEEFNVSNGPVREAFQILEKYHLVEIIPRKGVRVSEMTSDFIRNLFEVVIELTGFIVRRLCENRTEEELENLLELDCGANDLSSLPSLTKLKSLGKFICNDNKNIWPAEKEKIVEYCRQNHIIFNI